MVNKERSLPVPQVGERRRVPEQCLGVGGVTELPRFADMGVLYLEAVKNYVWLAP